MKNDESAEKLVEKGLEYYDSGNFQEAIKACDKALKVKPNYADAWYNGGLDLNSLKRYEEAIKACDKSIEIDFNRSDVWYSKGLALASLKRHEEAIECYNREIKIEPNYGESWYAKGLSMEALGKKDASKFFDKARQLRRSKGPESFKLSDLSSRIESDIWSSQDSLGYQLYADAIIEVLTNENTKAPIAISIQAPWGGGKTTLMRIIRNKLEPYSANCENIYMITNSKLI